jgi:hypothetical protein
LLVLLELIAGFEVVAQQTPRAVTSSPPLFVTLPPDIALVWVTPETFSVVTTGRCTGGGHEVRNIVKLIKRKIITGILIE